MWVFTTWRLSDCYLNRTKISDCIVQHAHVSWFLQRIGLTSLSLVACLKTSQKISQSLKYCNLFKLFCLINGSTFFTKKNPYIFVWYVVYLKHDMYHNCLKTYRCFIHVISYYFLFYGRQENQHKCLFCRLHFCKTCLAHISHKQ